MTASSTTPPKRLRWPWLLALLCLAAASGWLILRTTQPIKSLEAPRQTASLASGVVARMDSSAFTYSDGWRVSSQGADPAEPDDAWNEPSGQVAFVYSGRELALQLAMGDYWGYLFVTVDGAPANRLAVIPGNENSLRSAAGYKPLLAPEQQTDGGPATRWVLVHKAANDGPHAVVVEVWRSWGQIPLRGVAVDALPAPPLPLWPVAAFALAALWSLYFGLKNGTRIGRIKTDGNRGGKFPEFLSAPIRSIRQIRVLFFSADDMPGGTDSNENQNADFAENADYADFIRKFCHPCSIFRVGLHRIVAFWPIALLMIGAGVVAENWLLTDTGLALLALAALLRPELWVAALLFGLPFYLYPLPILPGRALNLIEIGIWGGLAILIMRNAECGMGSWWQVASRQSPVAGDDKQRVTSSENSPAETQRRREETLPAPTQYAIRNTQYPISNTQYILFLLLWSLLSALAAEQMDIALREWRTVFLAGGGFALLLDGVFAQSGDPARSRRVLFNAWLAGGTAVALIALWQFISGEMIIQAEGVTRVRGLYGSPNNLALYLERTVAVGIGYWVLGIGYSVFRIPYSVRRREYWLRNTQYAILLLPQLAALILTFSKGALFLGIPALLLVLGGGGVVLMARQGKSLRFLWWLAGIGGVVALGLLPFLGTERFRLLLDFGAGTTGGLRLNLWRSAWAMALDHPWLGVGPDNFLYAYRSGYILPAAWQDPHLNHPHNFVLDWYTRLGLPGLLLAGLWLGAGVRGQWQRLQSGADAGLALGCLAAVAAALAHGLIDASYALPDLMVVWVLLLGIPTAQSPQSPRPESRC